MGHICNDRICFINDFQVTEDKNEKIILDTPFIIQLKPYTTTLDEIHTTILRNRIIFSYINSISKKKRHHIKNKNIFRINLLSQKIIYLKEDINVKGIQSSFKKTRK